MQDSLVGGEYAMSSSRVKRSFVSASNYWGRINKDLVTWRMDSGAAYDNTIPLATQISVLASALRYWDEVLPICFQQNTRAPRVDIQFGFYQGKFD